ncbi:hypothetical protein IAU60_001287 [Kwoniella sp. DSM 27419]
MGNTPSHQHGSPQQSQGQGQGTGTGEDVNQQQRGHHRHHPNLRLPMPTRPTHVSPQASNPTSPSGRGTSPRRRKSLELPDLNKLAFTPAALTPAAPVPTTHTHTSHHLAPSTTASPVVASSTPKKWHQALGGRTASPLAGSNTLGAMSKLDPKPVQPPPGTPAETNPYFPSTAAQDASARAQTKSIPIPIPAQQPAERYSSSSRRVSPPKIPVPRDDENDGLGLTSSTHDFNTILRLPPGQYRLKFIVDDSWRCSKQISTATDDDGTLVNWIEVEAPKTEEEIKAEWAMDAKPAVKLEDELPSHFSPEEYSQFMKSIPYQPSVPAPPTLPRLLDRVIVNTDNKRNMDLHEQQTGYNHGAAALDDNSILAVPNHTTLNHLTASAIRNGTLGVGTTTRYRKKYITTMFFKPTHADMPGADSVASSVQPQSVQ